jgi:heme O synthase-like polyprenyltransferase
MIILARRLHESSGLDKRLARRAFAFSILHLFLLFAALLADAAAPPSPPR